MSINCPAPVSSVLKKTARCTALGLLLSLVQPVASFAAEELYLEELVVTGSRLTEPAAQPNTFVLNAQAIANQQPVSVINALQYVPGVYVSQPGGRGGVASLSIRGAESNFAVILVDGVQVNDPTNTRGGSFDFSTIDINEVHRIELLRGAAAAIYGSDALSGVINIITYDPQRPKTEITISTGEDSLVQAGLRSTVKSQGLGVFHLAASTIEDDNPAADATFESNNVRLNYDNQWQEHLFTARLSAANAEQRSFPEDSGGRDFAVIRTRDERETDSISAAFGYRVDLSSEVSLQADASHYSRNEDFVSPGIAGGARNPFGVPPNSSDTDFKRTELSAFGEYRKNSIDVVFGSQWQREDGEADGEVTFIGPTFFALERDTVGVFVELFSEITPHIGLSAGLRTDKADGLSSETTYTISGEYTIADNLTVFAGSGSGFKLPSFFALGNPLVGNPDLEPERVLSHELGLRGQPATWLGFELVGFRSEYEDLIDFDSALFTNVNRSDVTMSGWDLSLFGSTAAEKLSYRLFSSYVDIDLKPTGRLRQRPQWRLGGAITYALTPALTMNVNWQHNDDRFDSSIPNPSVVLGSYQRVDLAAHWELRPRLRLTVALDNLTDETYEDADGFEAPSRRGRIGLKFTL